MAEYIEREALYKEVTEKYSDISGGQYPFNIVAYDMAQLVKNAPTADVVEVKHGEWLPIEHEYRNKFERVMIADEFDCSICGRRLGYRANYCPNCGAKMDAESKQQEAVSLVDGHIDKSNRCVSCGAEIPEGTWTCPSCDRRWQ